MCVSSVFLFVPSDKTHLFVPRVGSLPHDLGQEAVGADSLLIIFRPIPQSS